MWTPNSWSSEVGIQETPPWEGPVGYLLVFQASQIGKCPLLSHPSSLATFQRLTTS